MKIASRVYTEKGRPFTILQLTDMQVIDAAQQRTPDRLRPRCSLPEHLRGFQPRNGSPRRPSRRQASLYARVKQVQAVSCARVHVLLLFFGFESFRDLLKLAYEPGQRASRPLVSSAVSSIKKRSARSGCIHTSPPCASAPMCRPAMRCTRAAGGSPPALGHT